MNAIASGAPPPSAAAVVTKTPPRATALHASLPVGSFPHHRRACAVHPLGMTPARAATSKGSHHRGTEDTEAHRVILSLCPLCLCGDSPLKLCQHTGRSG